MSRIESGQVHIDVASLTWYLGILRVPYEVAVPLISLCRQARDHRGYWMADHGDRIPDAFSSLLYHEATADSSISYEPLLIPGFLQTQRYARRVISRNPTLTKSEVDLGVEIRIGRQRLVNERDRRFCFYIHEQALRTMVGDNDIMCEQLLALALVGGAPNVIVRVVRTPIGESPSLAGSFRIFEFEEYDPLVYLGSVVASFWIEDRAFVEPYGRLANHLAEISESVEESRSFIAALADEYDRGSIPHATDRVEEEHLQR